MVRQKYNDGETARLKQTYPQSYQIQHLNTWIDYPSSSYSGIRIGYSFKERFDIVTRIVILSFAHNYNAVSGYNIYKNPHSGFYQLNVLSFYKLQDIVLTVYYHFGKIIEKPTK